MTQTKWMMPDSFPDLSRAKIITIDIETRDDHLKELGLGVRRDAYIIGVAIGMEDGACGYYPVAHDEGPNLNRSAVFSWLKHELARPHQIKLGTNLLYDFDFLSEQGICIKGPWYDVQNAEPLIDENSGRYNLNVLAKKYLGESKKEDPLEEECRRRGFKGTPQKHLWRLPASVVAPYAEGDIDLPLRIFKKQKKILEAEKLWDLFILETRLMPLLLRMRRTGVRIDTKKLDQVLRNLHQRKSQKTLDLNKMAGMEVEYWAAASIGKAFDKLGLKYPRTPKTDQPSFTKDGLSLSVHPISSLILECRALDKFIGTFLEGSLKNKIIDDRIHASFNQQRSDEYGTVTGRFSSSDPNLQFIPIRDKEFGPLCRSMFIPDEGCLWGKADYSQIEFRIFAHFAIGEGSESFRKQYRDDPRIDYHSWCAEMAEISRAAAKTINFGIIYGMGAASVGKKLGKQAHEGQEFLTKYYSHLPFIRHTLQKAADKAATTGFIRTILGRRRRFILWEPFDRRLAQIIPMARDQKKVSDAVDLAILQATKNGEYPPRPGTRKAGTHKALSALIQGSAADLLKKAMVDCYEAGIFDILHPHLTVHDELDSSVPDTAEGREAFAEKVRLMESAIPFKVPIIVDAELMKNWGGVEDHV